MHTTRRSKSQRLEAEPLTRLWKEYKKGNDDLSLRNTLVEQYLHIVRFTADRIYAKLPGEIEFDDLVSAGVFGLVDAIRAFDLDRGVKFETYCAQRVRGAILDELRGLDWVPRLVRSRAHKVNRAAAELTATLGRSPTEEELACRLKLPTTEFQKVIRDSATVTQVPLSRKQNDGDSERELSEIDVLEDRHRRSPIKEIQRRDLREMITRGLSRAERLILILYYYEEMTMKEIGRVIDLSESRVSQMHSAVLVRLKQRLDAMQPSLLN